eukprot:12897236-Alexandrium_andersonii.AAC.1
MKTNTQMYRCTDVLMHIRTDGLTGGQTHGRAGQRTGKWTGRWADVQTEASAYGRFVPSWRGPLVRVTPAEQQNRSILNDRAARNCQILNDPAATHGQIAQPCTICPTQELTVELLSRCRRRAKTARTRRTSAHKCWQVL